MKIEYFLLFLTHALTHACVSVFANNSRKALDLTHDAWYNIINPTHASVK